MNSPPNRTTFTRRGAIQTMAAGVVLPSLSRLAPGIEPIARSAGSHIKLGLAAYSLRDHFRGELPNRPPLTMPQFIDYCASLDIDGAELTSYFFPDSFARPYLNDLKRQAHLLGLDICGGAIGNNFTVDRGESLNKQMALTKKWIEHYATLGAPVIRIFAGKPPAGVSEQEAIRRCVPAIEEACEYAGKHGVMLALENHDFTMKIERLLEIVQAVKSPWFGVNLDSGNIETGDPYEAMEKMAPYAVNAQLKVEFKKGDRKGPTDINRVVKILQYTGYRGYLVLEYESEPDPYEAIPKFVEILQSAIA